MRPTTIAVLVVLSFLVLLFTGAGCGGGGDGGGLLNRGGTSTISSADPSNPDGSHYEVRHFMTTKSGDLTIDMMRTNSTNSLNDPYIIVWLGHDDLPSLSTLIGCDDDSGIGLNAHMDIYAWGSGIQFSVMFTTYCWDDFGSYNWRVQEVVGTSSTSSAGTGTVEMTASESTTDPCKAAIAAENKLNKLH